MGWKGYLSSSGVPKSGKTIAASGTQHSLRAMHPPSGHSLYLPVDPGPAPTDHEKVDIEGHRGILGKGAFRRAKAASGQMGRRKRLSQAVGDTNARGRVPMLPARRCCAVRYGTPWSVLTEGKPA